MTLDAQIPANPLPCLLTKYFVFLQHDLLRANRSGITEVKYITGLYALWDSLLAGNQALKYIDDCSSGGRRIDFETLHRSIPLWPTDFDEGDDPEAFQSHHMGLSQMTSIFGAAAHGIDPYSWRSAGMVGKMLWWNASWDAWMKVPASREQLRLAIAETISLRPYVIFGDYCPLTTIDVDAPWAVYQVHRHTTVDGYVMAFRRSKSTNASITVSLVDIVPDRQYTVTHKYDYTANATATMQGTTLANLTITLSAPSQCVLVMYKAQ